MVSYPCRQQYRRLFHAVSAAIGSAAAALLALTLAGAGATLFAGFLVFIAFGLGLSARHWVGLAQRSRIGARSEDEVRHRLAAFEKEGWRLRHSLPWRGRGDIDSVAIAPRGLAFAIETKTRAYHDLHLTVLQQQAAWLWRRRRRWCPRGATPVLCVVRAVGIQRWERGVLVVSIDALIPTLRHAASEGARPRA